MKFLNHFEKKSLFEIFWSGLFFIILILVCGILVHHLYNSFSIYIALSVSIILVVVILKLLSLEYRSEQRRNQDTKDRRIKVIRLDKEDILEFLIIRKKEDKNNSLKDSVFTYFVIDGMPSDVKYNEVYYNYEYRCFEIVIESEEFKEIKVWDIIPAMNKSCYKGKFKQINTSTVKGDGK